MSVAICVAVKHGEVERHESIIEALQDIMECIDQRGLEVWWEEPGECPRGHGRLTPVPAAEMLVGRAARCGSCGHTESL